MGKYKYLVGGWLEIFDALGQDTEEALLMFFEDVIEESHTSPHEIHPPVSDEAIEILQEISDHSGIPINLDTAWQGT
jgi:hypothetical protein